MFRFYERRHKDLIAFVKIMLIQSGTDSRADSRLLLNSILTWFVCCSMSNQYHVLCVYDLVIIKSFPVKLLLNLISVKAGFH